MTDYYNENDPQAAQFLENLIAERLIPAGVVDRRSILDVQPADLRGFRRHHFFAGIGGWALAAELAGWPADRPLWTGSCPCQPFSLAGQKLGADDQRHLWPDFFRLIDAERPPTVVGEQVAGALGYGWLDGVTADLGRANYASGAVDIPAAAMDSPQIRQRLYWVALGTSQDGSGVGSTDSDGGGRLFGSFLGSQAEAQRQGRIPDWIAGDIAAAADEGRGPRSDLASRDGPGLRALGRDTGEGAGDQAGASGPDHDAALPGGRDAAGSGRPGSVADRPGELGGEQQPVWGPEGRTVAAGDDARERGISVLGEGEVVGRGSRFRQTGALGYRAQPADADGASGTPALGAAQGRGLAVGEQPAGLGGYAGGWSDAPRADVPNGSWWADHSWIICHDDRARRVPEPGIPLLVTGVSGRLAVLRSGRVAQAADQGQEVRLVSRVAAWRGFGNAINPVLAAEVLKALLDD